MVDKILLVYIMQGFDYYYLVIIFTTEVCANNLTKNKIQFILRYL
jgi:hypothetical protein